MNKKNLCLIFGGYSAEHDVSIMSAASIAKTADKNKYNLHYIGFNKKGMPYLVDEISTNSSEELFNMAKPLDEAMFVRYLKENVDIVFPIIHGPGGEDGKLQGLLDYIAVPYVGPAVTASALCMDKRLSKEVFKANGFLQSNYISLSKTADLEIDKIIQKIEGVLEYPLFVKPSNLGSSIGITKVKDERELKEAIDIAFRYDRHILIEQGVDARELECAVYGNQEPIAMSVGEIIPSHEMYDYEAKYSDDALSELVIPAQIDESVINTIKSEAVRAYQLLGIEGMARVDFLVDKKTHDVYLNEINTLPGFTKYSMFPLLCKDAGLAYRDLIDTLIELGLERRR